MQGDSRWCLVGRSLAAYAVLTLLYLDWPAVETASESADPYRDDPLALPRFSELELASATNATVVDEPVRVEEPVRIRPRAPRRTRARLGLSASARQELMWIVVIYMAARLLLLLAAFLQASFGHHPFQDELANWDGFWYREVANKGYPPTSPTCRRRSASSRCTR